MIATHLSAALVAGLFAGSTLGSVHQTPDAAAPDQMLGTWSYLKDGFRFTATYRPILEGRAIERTLMLDETGTDVATSIYSRDAASGQWTETWFDQQGNRASFRQGESAAGLALEMIAFNGETLVPPPSRKLHTIRADGDVVMDWQTRTDESGWSPRPEPFVYQRVERPNAPGGDGRIAFISTRDGNWEIYTMNPDGSDVRNISNSDATDHAPHWLAGGQRLSFRSMRATPDGVDLPEANGGWSRWEVDRDGTDLEIADVSLRGYAADFGTFPNISPDGSYAAYTTERDGELDLFVSRFDGGGERRIGSAPGPDYRPTWSPDGTKLLLISERDGDQEIYVVDVASGEATRLTESVGADRYARWSPDGSQIAFGSARVHGEQGLDLFVMEADGSGVRQVTNSAAEDGEISWSPDSTRLAFRRTERFEDGSSQAEVMVIELDSLIETNLSNNEAYDGEPVWSP